MSHITISFSFYDIIKSDWILEKWLLQINFTMIKSEPTLLNNNFDRPKLLLFKFLAHQIHPFAYAVNTFLRPALGDCLKLISNNPQDTFNVLLSLSQTFTRFAPETELIYDDIKQFAIKLKDALDQCFTSLDPDTIQQSSQLLETTHESLLKIIQQQSTENTTYTDMYKNMSAVLTNLEKINSLPTELQNVSTKPSEPSISNGYSHRTISSLSNRITTPPIQTRIHPLANQMKTLSVSQPPPPPTTISHPSYLSEYEVVDTCTQPIKTSTSTSTIASFPPRQTPSLFTSRNHTNEHYSSSLLNEVIKNDHLKLNGSLKNENQHDTPNSMFSSDGNSRLGNTNRPRTLSITSSVHDDMADNEETNSRKYQFNSRLMTDQQKSNVILPEQSRLDQTKAIAHPHVTDEYMQEFGHKKNRPQLHGELCTTFGTPQNGHQSTCLPIGVGLSYDELTLLSCDVHRNAQHVRLFDVQTGRLKHTINSNQNMKFHRPAAVMSNARENVFIVERDSIYITESDGRYIQTLTHRSIKQLYGIASFRDRYVLTMDSKSFDNQSSENCRLLLFDPNSRQLVFEQNISINHQSEAQLKQQYINHIQGQILPNVTSKPRFLAVHNDEIYIADLGRSLIYGTQLRNQFDFTCKTVFGGCGRANGEFTEPSGLYIDSGGNIISADSKNDRIQLFSSDGEYKAVFKLNERIKRPSGICSNRAGTQFYVSCYLAGCVRAYNIRY